MSNSEVKIDDIINVSEEIIDASDDKSMDQLDINVNCDDLALMEDKSFIIDLVNKMDKRLTFISKEGKSQAWIRYQKIYYKNMETNFVKCIHCNDIKKHNKYLGTATMLRHQCIKNSDFHEEYQIKNNKMFSSVNGDNTSVDLDESNEEFYNNKDFLQTLIDSGDERLTFEPQIGKSEAWNRFERVLYNNIETLYVKCKTCNDIHKQTRFLGTTSLLRHRCQSQRTFIRRLRQTTRKATKKIKSKSVKIRRKCETIDEKIRVENKTLKTIIKKCLEMTEKCLCVNRTIVLEKKQINVLINAYNEWLIENQDLEDSEEFSEDFDDIFGDHKLLSPKDLDNDLKLDLDSNCGSDYDPSEECQQKYKTKLTQIRNSKSRLVLASDLVKKKYIKSKTKSIYNCDYPECGRSFNNSYNLMQHRNKHNPNKYLCDWPGCDEKFSKKIQYEIHISLHTNEKKYKCDYDGCNYETCHSLRLIRHKKLHSGEKPFKCDWPGCEFATSHKNGLRHHKYRHSGEKPYKCSWPSCDWSFRQSTHLKAHMLKHTGERPYPCEVMGCERSFTSRQAMRFHAEKVHNVVIPLK